MGGHHVGARGILGPARAVGADPVPLAVAGPSGCGLAAEDAQVAHVLEGNCDVAVWRVGALAGLLLHPQRVGVILTPSQARVGDELRRARLDGVVARQSEVLGSRHVQAATTACLSNGAVEEEGAREEGGSS